MVTTGEKKPYRIDLTKQARTLLVKDPIKPSDIIQFLLDAIDRGDVADPRSPAGLCQICQIEKDFEDETEREELEKQKQEIKKEKEKQRSEAAQARSLEAKLFPVITLEEVEAEHQRLRREWFNSH